MLNESMDLPGVPPEVAQELLGLAATYAIPNSALQHLAEVVEAAWEGILQTQLRRNDRHRKRSTRGRGGEESAQKHVLYNAPVGPLALVADMLRSIPFRF